MCIRDRHYIRYDVLYAYVLVRLQYWSMLAQKDEAKLLKRLLTVSDRERNSAKKKPVSYTHLDVYKRQLQQLPDFSELRYNAGGGLSYEEMNRLKSVSYTHLDVYKRQGAERHQDCCQ